MERINPRKILRSPSLKRKTKVTPISNRVTLEKVLGFTVTSNAALSCDPNTGTIAYPAGCVVVLLNTKKQKQTHLFNASKKTITCLAFSPDGKYLATGESGHQPAVRVWDLEEKTQIAEFVTHKFGISCVAFSPNNKYLVSVGSQHDMMVNVWSWKTNTKVASNKVAAKVAQVAFSEDGSYFVTVGNRHVKFWYLNASKSRINETVPLQGRSGILGEQRNNYFCGVCCGRGSVSSSTYAITKSGLLCEFNEKRLLDKWVELRTTGAHCVAVGEDNIFIGCDDGIVRIFNAHTLHFISTMPKPHYLGVDVAAGIDASHAVPQSQSAKHPDTIAIALDDVSKKVTSVYNDHSLYTWDIRDIRKIGKSRSYLYHSGTIWGIDIYPELDEDKAVLPNGSFFTCSSDNTVRIWNLDPQVSSFKRNIYSNELLKVIYTEPELSNILDKEFNPAGKTDKTDTTCLEKNGVRCIKISPDGQHLASGDRMGNIRIHELQFMDEINSLEAHDSEVLCLEYTSPTSDIRLLSSASRDRLIHVFDVEQNYGLVQTLDDHSAAITSVKFLQNGDQLNMVSCGADKSLLFRSAQAEPDFGFVLNRHLVGKTTLYDMDVDPTDKFVCTACQDRNVRIYNIRNGKQKKCYKGALGDDGTLIRIQLDPSGAYAATCCSDKNLYVYDFFTGECMATMFGHSEVPTGIKFMNDLKHVISVSGDGCVFVWKLPYEVTEGIHRRLAELGQRPKEELTKSPLNSLRRGTFAIPTDLSQLDDNDNPNMTSKEIDYRFSVGQLPAWAKKQVQDDGKGNASTGMPNPSGPRGRWAARADNNIVMKSMLDDKRDIQLSLADSIDRRRFTVEPDALQDQINDVAKGLRRDTIVIDSDKKLPNIPIITDDDVNNQDDEEDDEFFGCTREQAERRFQMDKDNQNQMAGKITMKRGPDGLSQGEIKEGHPWDISALQQNGSEEEDVEYEEEDEDEEGVSEKDNLVYFMHESGSETSETAANSFRVFEGDSGSIRDEGFFAKMRLRKGSESNDMASVDSDQESEPSTPIDHKEFPDESFNKGEFVRNNFENLEGFGNSTEALKHLQQSEHSLNARHSISTKFLSRGQQQHLQRIAEMNSRNAQAANGNKRKEEPPKVIDDNKRKNQGWRGNDDVFPEKDISSHPGRLGKDEISMKGRHSFPSEGRPPSGGQQSRRSSSDDAKPMLTGERMSRARLSLPSNEGTINARRQCRKWKSMMNIDEDSDDGWPKERQRTPSRTRARSKTPTRANRLSLASPITTFSRAESPTKFGPSVRRRRIKSPRIQVAKNEITLESPTMQRKQYGDERKLSTSSTEGTMKKSRPSLSRGNSYQMPTQSSMSKSSRTSSSTNLNKEEGEPPSTPKTSRSRRGRLSTALKAKFKSTPDLVTNNEDEDSLSEKSPTRVPSRTAEDAREGRRSVPIAEMKKSVSRKSMPAQREMKDPFGRDSAYSTDNTVRSSTDSMTSTSTFTMNMEVNEGEPSTKEDADRKAMPPPSLKTNSLKSTRKSNSNMTLAQAKEILLGKSSSNLTVYSKENSTESKKVDKNRPNTSLGALTSSENTDYNKPNLRGRGRNKSPSRTLPKTPLELSQEIPRELDASPIEPPVKDHAPQREQDSEHREAKSRVEITNFRLGGSDTVAKGRVSPFVNNNGGVKLRTRARSPGPNVLSPTGSKPGLSVMQNNTEKMSSPAKPRRKRPTTPVKFDRALSPVKGIHDDLTSKEFPSFSSSSETEGSSVNEFDAGNSSHFNKTGTKASPSEQQADSRLNRMLQSAQSNIIQNNNTTSQGVISKPPSSPGAVEPREGSPEEANTPSRPARIRAKSPGPGRVQFSSQVEEEADVASDPESPVNEADKRTASLTTTISAEFEKKPAIGSRPFPGHNSQGTVKPGPENHSTTIQDHQSLHKDSNTAVKQNHSTQVHTESIKKTEEESCKEAIMEFQQCVKKVTDLYTKVSNETLKKNLQAAFNDAQTMLSQTGAKAAPPMDPEMVKLLDTYSKQLCDKVCELVSSKTQPTESTV